jgi:hypothetical protein
LQDEAEGDIQRCIEAPQAALDMINVAERLT